MKKVLSWAWFAYGISNGEIALDSTFDEYFVPLKSREGRKEFAESFYPSSEENDGSDFMLKGQEIAWIFNNLCADAFDSETCTVIHDSRTIRLSALGAVLHLIQDSFSQSHANRESCTQIKKGENVASSVMNCSPITQFYDYSDQSSDKHEISDHMPVKVGESCGEDIDDAITASAKIIWFATKNKSALEVENYLKEHVFVSPKNNKGIKDAGPGVCYKKDEGFFSWLF